MMTALTGVLTNVRRGMPCPVRRGAGGRAPSPRAARRRRGGSDGQIIVTFAIALSLFIVGLIAMVADLSTMFGASALVNQAAQSGAFSAATDVDFTTFRSTGVVKLNTGVCATGSTSPSGASVAAAMGTTAYITKCVTSGAQVDVTVSAAVALPVNFGLPTQTVSATYRAYAQQGTTKPG